jgi:ribokinase
VTLGSVRVAVVGHVEWVQFARVERVPVPGTIVHAQEWWEEPAGGGAVAAVQLARLAGEADLFTAFGDDDLGHRAREELSRLGVRVHAVDRSEPQRRAFTFVDEEGERTITVLGRRLVAAGDDPLPWDRLKDADAVYFTGGDAGALRNARAARVLTATPRAGEQTLAEAGVGLDALIGRLRGRALRRHRRRRGDMGSGPAAGAGRRRLRGRGRLRRRAHIRPRGGSPGRRGDRVRGALRRRLPVRPGSVRGTAAA